MGSVNINRRFLQTLRRISSVLMRNTRNVSSTSIDNQEVDPEKQVEEQQKRNEEVGQFTELVRDFLDPKDFYDSLRVHGIDFYCGVPDSLLKDFCAYVTAIAKPEDHVITSNEGSAVALAAGYHMATHKPALVYLQNSGLGNIVNPLMSLAVPAVYSIPMLLLVGWRGEPGKRDEPQHLHQGQATPGLLASCGIPFQVLPDYQEGAEQAIYTAKKYMQTSKGPYCLLVKRQTFLPYKLQLPEARFILTREESLKCIVDNFHDKDVVVATTGMLSRELFEYRVSKCQGHEKDFLCVGSMGHASAIALGIAKKKKNRQVFCLDGDGALLMHMGNMATIGQQNLSNYKHIVINNGAHDSVGAQPTDAHDLEKFKLTELAKACGYKMAMQAATPEEISAGVMALRENEGPCMLEILCNIGSRKNLGRPTRSPIENKADFMHFLAIER